MNFNGYPVFDFNSDKVEAYCDNLISDKLEYLSCVHKAIQCADAIGHKVPDDFRGRFREKVEKFAGEVIAAKNIIKGSSQQTSQDGIDSLFKGPPLYGFDPQVLEVGMATIPNLEGQAAFIIHILREILMAVACGTTIPEDFAIKLATIETNVEINLILLGAQKQERTLEEIRNEFDFYKVKQHLETLPDTKARIQYLIERKTEYEQQGIVDQPQYERFDQKCDLEIKKLEKLMALEILSESRKEPQAESEAVTRNPEFTTARQVLAIHYLLQYRQMTQATNADVARFIEFLTGKNNKNIYKRVCNPLGSRDKELTDDLRFIRAFFEKLGLTEIVKMINNEINSGSF
ncbi:MAG: hypothetical protein ACLGJB_27050 [Blastocatellia bacterium]